MQRLICGMTGRSQVVMSGECGAYPGPLSSAGIRRETSSRLGHVWGPARERGGLGSGSAFVLVDYPAEDVMATDRPDRLQL